MIVNFRQYLHQLEEDIEEKNQSGKNLMKSSKKFLLVNILILMIFNLVKWVQENLSVSWVVYLKNNKILKN